MLKGRRSSASFVIAIRAHWLRAGLIFPSHSNTLIVMAFLDGFQLPEAQVCMTLASFAYLYEDTNDYQTIQSGIETYLADGSANYATGTDWQLVWLGLTSDYNNLMYVAASPQLGQFAIVHRGTDWNDLDDIVEDLDIYHTTTWPYVNPVNNDIQVSNGALAGLNKLQALTSAVWNLPTLGLTQPVTLLELIQALANEPAYGPDIDIFVTGHSLGGALTTINTSWLIDTISQLSTPPTNAVNFKTYSFAAPTVGNQAYADYYNGQTSNAQVGFQGYRVHTQQDLVPYGFGNLMQVVTNGIPLGWEGVLKVAALVAGIQTSMQDYNVSYVQVGSTSDNSAYQLNNSSPNTTCPNPVQAIDPDYMCWVMYEHDHNTYLTLLGATNVPYPDPNLTASAAKPATGTAAS